MRKMLWVLCGLSIAVPTSAAPNEGCMTSRATVIKAANERDCAEEKAEAEAMTCDANAIKDAKRLYVLIKQCHAKPKKDAASSSASSSTKPAVDMKMTGPSDTVEVPPGKHQCRAADPADGKVFAASGTDTTSLDCLKALKEKVAELRCEGSTKEVKYLYQTPRSGGRWSDGVDSTARCKK
jgi:hypothetical protein